MNVIEMRPLEFRDFSGGLTDNILQGDLKRYAVADNFLITVDSKLEVRPGTKLYDQVGYSLPSASGRVSGLFTAINDSFLVAQANRDLYTQVTPGGHNVAWTKIQGPTGNEAIGGGGNYSQLTTAEFQRQTYYTSDARVQPGKIFRDQNNSWKAVTAGLPAMEWSPNFPYDDALLARCIQLANALRTSMVNHFGDSANIGSGTSTVYQHKLVDKWSLSYFETQVFNPISDPEYPGPVPAPTPAPAATDFASLQTLCVALSLAYEHHRNDLTGGTPETGAGDREYHQDTLYNQAIGGGSGIIPGKLGLGMKLSASGVVQTVQRAATFLDDLAQKWYWHQLLPFGHSPTNNLAQMSKHLINVAKIGTVYSSANELQVEPNLDDFIAFAAWIREAHRKHIENDTSTTGGGSPHSEVDSDTLITLQEPFDYDSAVLTIFWARWMYGEIHVYDSNWSFFEKITFDTTVGSPNITNVTLVPSGLAATLTVGLWVTTLTDKFNDTNSLSRRAARVSASAAGTATLTKTAIATGATVAGQQGGAESHIAFDGSAFINASASAVDPAEFLETGPGAVGNDLETWITLGTEYLLALGAHESNEVTHYKPDAPYSAFVGNSSINGNPFFIPQIVSLAYAAHYRYQYTVEPNGIAYVSRGAPTFSRSIQTCASFPVGTILDSINLSYLQDCTIEQQNPSATITGIPELVNTTLTNYDTTVSVVPIPTNPNESGYYNNLTIELYKTSDGGTAFYFLDRLTNGATSFEDTINENYPELGDDPLTTRPLLYTSGGRVADDSPPKSKFTHSVGGFTYYGAIEDSGQFFPQRIRQSLQGAPDSAPALHFDDLEDELVAISSARNNPIAICRSSIYRLSGSFNSLGQGAIIHEKISTAQGGLNAKSVVQTEIGLFFAGTDGFYYTDGYQLIKISLEIDDTYLSLTRSAEQKDRIYGAYDRHTRRIWWAMQSQPTAPDNDVFFIYYLDYGVKPSGVFTKALTKNSWKPASCAFFQGELVIGDSRGYLFKTDPNKKTDPYVQTSVTPTSWRTVYIPWDFRTCALDFGTTYKRKWVTKIHSIGQNVGNGAIQINSINDAGTTPSGITSNLPLAPIQYRANPMWGDPTVIWGTEDYNWKYDGAMDVWRRFPARSMRSDFKQVQYVPGNFVVYRSDDYPGIEDGVTMEVNATLKRATLVTDPTSAHLDVVWPLDVVDYYISFDTDNYENEYLITALQASNTRIVYSDSGNLSTTSTNARWQIKGYKKEQRIRITAFDIHFGYLGSENEAYPGDAGSAGLGVNS